MMLNWKKFTASILCVMALVTCLPADPPAAGRIVILAPAAADILERLGASEDVVGVTNSVGGFSRAVRVGTHLHPGVETVAGLRPGLIIATSRFDPALAARMHAELFVYEPKTLDDIVLQVQALARALGREVTGKRLAETLQTVLDELVLPEHRPTVLFETRSAPLGLAGNNSITADLLVRAGMRYAGPERGGLFSAEYLMAHQPDYYLYQHGPMNKNPLPPKTRPGWEHFRSCVWKVDEFDFSRPNTQLFETVKTLNAILQAPDVCTRGAAIYP